MAFIGMRRPVFALVSEYTEGSAITYGTGEVIAPARRASITYEREDNPFYGDDVEQENDVGLNGYTIELETTALPIATRAALLGEVHSYVWDEKARMKGEERPVKVHDHAMDAVRYLCHTKASRFRR